MNVYELYVQGCFLWVVYLTQPSKEDFSLLLLILYEFC